MPNEQPDDAADLQDRVAAVEAAQRAQEDSLRALVAANANLTAAVGRLDKDLGDIRREIAHLPTRADVTALTTAVQESTATVRASFKGVVDKAFDSTSLRQLLAWFGIVGALAATIGVLALALTRAQL